MLALAAAFAQAATTGFMTGVIWYAQVVHYPIFDGVPPADFPRYQRRNVTRTAWLVLPPMLVELLAGTVFLLARPPAVPPWAAITGFVLLGVIWISTVFLLAPLHGRIAERWDEALNRLVVQSNWIRTLAWSARLPLVLFMLARLLRNGDTIAP